MAQIPGIFPHLRHAAQQKQAFGGETMGFRHAFIIFDCLKKGIMKKQLVILAAIIAAAVSCGSKEGFTEREKAIINGQEGPMYVTVINDPEDSVILRTPSLPLTKKMLESPEFKALAKKMLIFSSP